MLTSRRQGWDLTVIKKAYTTLILLYSACWEKGDSLQNIYKKVISKARMLPPLFHTIPRENQIVLGTYRSQSGAHRCTRGNSSRATCSGWKREFRYLDCKEQTLTNYLRPGRVHCEVTHGNKEEENYSCLGWSGSCFTGTQKHLSARASQEEWALQPHLASLRLKGNRKLLHQQEHIAP